MFYPLLTCRNHATNIARLLVLLNDHRHELLASEATVAKAGTEADRRLARTAAWKRHLSECFRGLEGKENGDVLACHSPHTDTCVFYFSGTELVELSFFICLVICCSYPGVGTVDTVPQSMLQKVRAKLGALNEAIDQDRADAAMKDKVSRAKQLVDNYKQYV
jgi:hypothetical protein